MKRIVAIAAALAAVTLTGAIAWSYAWLTDPLPIEGEQVFEVRTGSSFAAISRDLADRGIIEHPQLYGWYARLSGAAEQVHAGEYLISGGTTPASLLEQFVSGDVRLYSFTIVEGWTFRELMAALAEDDRIARTLTYEDWPALLERLGADHASPEGLFLPETYRFPRNTRDVDLLRRAYDLMQRALEEEWAQRDGGLPLDSPYEALTLASIIEKETALAEERPRIAGVFVRRLRQGMRLQTDPTVIYGLGEAFDGNLTRRHLRTDTPYNTYTRRGLPPGPIALPGRAAIRAALQPAEGDELFFVATGLGDGSHKFSATREEHEAAVAEYLARRRAARDGN